MRKRKSILIATIVVISICAICIFESNYVKKANVSASNIHIKKHKKVVIKKNKIKKVVMSSVNDCNIEACKPGEVFPWELQRSNPNKIAYLTFDDGPSINNTKKILNILDQNNIKATFFLIGKNAERYPELAKLEVADGQSVANHTYSHFLNYRESPEAFLEDTNRCDTVLKSILGDKYIPKFMRFPGGSWGNRLEPFRAAVAAAGYRFVNWNALNGDAEHPFVPVDALINHVERDVQGKNKVLILMHDAPAKTTTVQALPAIIQYLKSQGFTFGKLV
ncbi:polysaccharide deacetylase family protein [Clostridium hydrogenum]|uniref:polysaccharide deacetylase family protein n=1 Tax=Clostridium hydrogenum TaxID=2855764 RepID=UPI001F25F5B0|nr:polysaccharide deacetylase family protein [Clostridium hydrogenum]